MPSSGCSSPLLATGFGFDGYAELSTTGGSAVLLLDLGFFIFEELLAAEGMLALDLLASL